VATIETQKYADLDRLRSQLNGTVAAIDHREVDLELLNSAIKLSEKLTSLLQGIKTEITQ